MNIGFNFKSPIILDHSKRISLSLEALKPGTDFLSSYKSPRQHLLLIYGYFFNMENLFSKVATFFNDLSYIFWITCCSFYISIYCFIPLVPLCYGSSFSFKPGEPTAAGFKLFFYSFLTSSGIRRIEKSQILALNQVLASGNIMAGLISYPDHSNFLHKSNKAISLSYHLRIH